MNCRFELEDRTRLVGLLKRSSEVLGAIKTEFDKYGNVVSALSKQLTTASNSVENLGKRTRAMSRKLKDVELLSDQQSAENLLGLSTDEMLHRFVLKCSKPGPFEHDFCPRVVGRELEVDLRNALR